MKVKIRHEKDTESVLLCNVNGPDDVESVVKALARSGGGIVSKSGNREASDEPSSKLRYDFVLTEKEFYAEIVVHDNQAESAS